MSDTATDQQNFFTLAGVVKINGFWTFIDSISSSQQVPKIVDHNAGLKSCIKRNTSHVESMDVDTDNAGKKKTSLRWGTVEEILCSRDIGFTSVPNHGGYPLGLGPALQHQLSPRSRGNSIDLSHVLTGSAVGSSGGVGLDDSLNLYTLEEHIALRQGNLHRRALACKDGSMPVLPAMEYETRTYDYKCGQTNPYFSSTVEALRITTLLRANDEHIKRHGGHGGGSKRRSSGVHAAASGDAASISALLVDVNKEVKNIQQWRSSSSPTPGVTVPGQFSGGNGCSCHVQKLEKLAVPKLKSMLVGLYKNAAAETVNDIPGSVDAPAAPLNAPGVVIQATVSVDPKAGASLVADVAAVAKMTRVELLARIKEANKTSQECGLCSTMDCECMAAGVPCCYSTCDCLKHISTTDKQNLRKRSRSLSADLSAMDVDMGTIGAVCTGDDNDPLSLSLCTPCCNPAGLMGLYDSETVRQHRALMMTRFNSQDGSLSAASAAISNSATTQPAPIPVVESSPSTPSGKKNSNGSGSSGQISATRQGKNKSNKLK